MNEYSLQELIGNTDIYLLDQVMKDRYKHSDKILDAGCGGGKNLVWFLKNDIEIYGVDRDATPINYLKSMHVEFEQNRFVQADVEKLPFVNNFFDHVISSAVLHFAENKQHFNDMMKEMVRVLKPGGSLFIRMTSDIGIENKVRLIEDGVYDIPDGSVRFLLTRELLDTTLQKFKLSFLEPLKTVNVNDIRCMTTLVLKKN
jgi:tellurite methyltransferase